MTHLKVVDDWLKNIYQLAHLLHRAVRQVELGFHLFIWLIDILLFLIQNLRGQITVEEALTVFFLVHLFSVNFLSRFLSSHRSVAPKDERAEDFLAFLRLLALQLHLFGEIPAFFDSVSFKNFLRRRIQTAEVLEHFSVEAHYRVLGTVCIFAQLF